MRGCGLSVDANRNLRLLGASGGTAFGERKLNDGDILKVGNMNIRSSIRRDTRWAASVSISRRARRRS